MRPVRTLTSLDTAASVPEAGQSRAARTAASFGKGRRPRPAQMQSQSQLASWSIEPGRDPAGNEARILGEVKRNLLVAERGRRLYLLKPEKIDYVEAHGNYVKLGVAGNEYIKRDTIKRLSIILADSGFFRIARSVLINVAAVLYVERVGQGVFAFTLTSGGCMRSGARYRKEILQVLPLTKVSPRSWRSVERVVPQPAVRLDRDV
jgi:DNA-binding LytR/AlgR family response regulator